MRHRARRQRNLSAVNEISRIRGSLKIGIGGAVARSPHAGTHRAVQRVTRGHRTAEEDRESRSRRAEARWTRPGCLPDARGRADYPPFVRRGPDRSLVDAAHNEKGTRGACPFFPWRAGVADTFRACLLAGCAAATQDRMLAQPRKYSASRVTKTLREFNAQAPQRRS